NDTDPESDVLTVVTTPVTGPVNGMLALSPDGSYSYTHGGSETVSDSFVYAISDGKGGTAQATTTITINPVNDAPVAAAQALATDEDTAITPVTLTASDAENSPLTFAVTAQPTNGTLSGTAPDLTYTPDPDYAGPDSFDFSASDGELSSVATVTITVNPVNDPPVASPQLLATNEDTATGTITLTATDADSDPLAYAITSPPTNGSLSGSAPAVTYTPDQDFHGTDSFTFSANDGTDSSSATITITVDPVNDPPVATADTATVAEGESLAAPADTLLANDSDPDNDLLTVGTTPLAGPDNGTLTLGTDGSFTYSHDGSETTSDSFTYEISDGTETAQATVAITITPVRDPVITRAPYIQSLATTSAIIRWSTDEETDSVVRYGTDPANLTSAATGTGSDHSVTLTGLTPETTYFYSVGDSVDAIATSPDYYLTTYADPGTASATRLWVLGDNGTSPSSATAVRDAFATYNGDAHADALILLGNNVALPADSDAYQASLFDLLPATLGNSPAWPTPGTNEATNSATYFGTFDQPAYYSFDHANIHVVSLDTATSDLSPGGTMATWLNTDLTNNLQEWVIVFFHHPPYSKGLHDSDASGSVLEEVRTNILPILEANGADLVLSAHSHSYERSALLDGHYGDSTTFAPAMAIDAGDGDPAGAGGYVKQPVANAGTVYAVVGSSGELDLGAGSLNHPAMVSNIADLGSLVVDISGNQLDAHFLNATGTVRDTFQIRHETPVADVEIIIDNNDPEVDVNGRMESDTSATGFYADDYFHDRNRKKGDVYATFTPDITTPGTYSVSARWPADASHSADVPVNIVHADGSEVVSV
ncbi:MAG: Ig-like domain-containing protein, partial [Verrucomicrobiales bacterium]|nr:Ig-like domain-containing protein [Verrucomicrobiales bacterium]